LPSTSTAGASGSVFAVDANALIAALLRGKAMRIVTAPRLAFFTTVRTTWEVERYLPELAAELSRRGVRIEAEEVRATFRSLPIVALPESFYESQLAQARSLMEARDPDDVDILALALRLQVPLWTNDRHFRGLSGVQALTTVDMLSVLQSS